MQDTFFISDPPTADRPRKTFDGGVAPEALWDNVRHSHEGGAYGSIGYRYNWSPDESTRLVLRTHTTATSAAMLWRLASQRGPDGRVPPARYFSIDRVFRNETVDATHLVGGQRVVVEKF
jgi:phenylalanyl-tRNA synthetase alpha chain